MVRATLTEVAGVAARRWCAVGVAAPAKIICGSANGHIPPTETIDHASSVALRHHAIGEGLVTEKYESQASGPKRLSLCRRVLSPSHRS
eukprot:scaffold20974_cov32-Tisochrysis_lutea.AAC.1